MIELTKDNLNEYGKNFWKGVDTEFVTYEGTPVEFKSAKNLGLNLKGDELAFALEGAAHIGTDGVIISALGAEVAKKMKKLPGETPESFAHYYETVGCLDMPCSGTMITEQMLKEMFETSTRYRNGRLPMVLPQMAAVCDVYGVEPSLMFEKFNIRNYQELSRLGLPKGEVVLLATMLSPAEISAVGDSFERASLVSGLLAKRKGYADRAAHFIASHPHTDMGLLKKIAKHPEKYDIEKGTTVESLNSQSTVNEAVKESKKVEKAYKKADFKLKDCKCLLKDSPITCDKYKVRILDGDDPMQVMLGYKTSCCQHLGDAGETSMMYGLTNDHAGFWVIEDKDTGKIYAQAESWEANTDTLVFDNIEFANGAEIEKYVAPIAKYLANSPYRNIVMGCGYNEFSDMGSGFEKAPDYTPTVTARDIFVMSYEEDMWVADNKDESMVCKIPSIEKAQELLDEGYVTYYDYLYSDTDDNKGVVYLKKDGELSKFFKNTPYYTEEKNKNIFSHIYSERRDTISKYVSLLSQMYKEEVREFESR